MGSAEHPTRTRSRSVQYISNASRVALCPALQPVIRPNKLCAVLFPLLGDKGTLEAEQREQNRTLFFGQINRSSLHQTLALVRISDVFWPKMPARWLSTMGSSKTSVRAVEALSAKLLFQRSPPNHFDKPRANGGGLLEVPTMCW
jgi:hypothetical protein